MYQRKKPDGLYGLYISSIKSIVVSQKNPNTTKYIKRNEAETTAY
jgi:hypothetical protein